MSGNIHHYFAGNHTAKGFYSLYASNFQGLERIFVLKGRSASIKTQLLLQVAKTCTDHGLDIELIHTSADLDAVDGIIVPKLKTGFYSGPAHVFKPERAKVETIDTDTVLNSEKVTRKQRLLDRYEEKLKKSLLASHQSFETGLRVHDDLEVIYINNMDFAKADQAATELAEQLFEDVKPNGKSASFKHRFLGGSTPKGAVDYIPNLTEGLEKRYFIKGRAGTGKSTFLKRMIKEAEELGLSMEVYHCGFDPESIDMVIIRELSLCIFDSTDPHEYFPDREGDEVIDLYEKTVMPGTDEKFEEQIATLFNSYKSYMKKGTGYLKEAKRYRDRLENIYNKAAHADEIDRLATQLESTIEKDLPPS
ncbi:PRK06851 family protein [Bacillus piscicola]|uniref:PRK06851 family protein n=1 Tax=Bacillus piscicola TaxID=1632684 RepID=UPI001F09F764|nr:PRK06851 family protein [Bacillus piscicola]